MPRYIALLRAINVGGHTVKMDKLRKLFEEMDFANVETFIASGNVIFEAKEKDAAKLEKNIEAHLEKALGYAVGTYLRTPDELKAAADHEPFPRADGDGTYVIFVRDEPGADAKKRLAALESDDDRFAVHAREVYWWRRNGRMSDSLITGPQLAKAIGQPGTNRNLTTVRKMAAKYAAKE
ncbi:MAG TPA: DUF1697 domain-containing protein [Longimicrobium sp.]